MLLITLVQDMQISSIILRSPILTLSITNYLVSLAFFLKEKSLLNYILSKSDFTVFRKMYIKLKYYIYPFVKVIKRKLK
jgi:hypothetical protein